MTILDSKTRGGLEEQGTSWKGPGGLSLSQGIPVWRIRATQKGQVWAEGRRRSVWYWIWLVCQLLGLKPANLNYCLFYEIYIIYCIVPTITTFCLIVYLYIWGRLWAGARRLADYTMHSTSVCILVPCIHVLCILVHYIKNSALWILILINLC